MVKALPSVPTRSCANSAGPREPSRTGYGDRDEQRQQHQQGGQSPAAVDAALEDAADAAELRLLDVQQRQPGHRPDVDARSGHVGQRRCHDQVDTGALELPRQPPQTGLGQVGPGADRDGVRAGRAQRVDDAHGVPDHRHPLDLGGRGPVDAGADDLEAGMAGAAQLADELGARALSTDHDHLVLAAPVGPHPVQALPGGVAEQQRQHHGRRERDQDVDARRLQPSRRS
jgi:hypothetical protein